MRCDVIAEYVVQAVKDVRLKVPLVERLTGTKVELGKAIITQRRPNVITKNNLNDNAQKIAQAVNGVKDINYNRSRHKKIIHALTGKTGTFQTESPLAYHNT